VPLDLSALSALHVFNRRIPIPIFAGTYSAGRLHPLFVEKMNRNMYSHLKSLSSKRFSTEQFYECMSDLESKFSTTFKGSPHILKFPRRIYTNHTHIINTELRYHYGGVRHFVFRCLKRDRTTKSHTTFSASSSLLRGAGLPSRC